MNEIKLTRGDTESFSLSITDTSGLEYEMQEGDKLVFTVKKSVYDEKPIIQKDIVDKTFIIEHEDTKDLAYGTYYYDIQLTFANGSVSTIIKPSKFIVDEEVNFD